jgi:hypothetical protein
MRRLRAFRALAGIELTRGWFWVFLSLTALVGPAFVLLHARTEQATWEMRPLLSESATVDHFNTRGHSPTARADEGGILLFRTPSWGSSIQAPFSSAFRPGWHLDPAPDRRTTAGWTGSLGSLSTHAGASDFHQLVLPVLMLVAGVLSFPSRRELTALRIILPAGRWGCFAMLSGVLAFQVLLLSAASGIGTVVTMLAISGPDWKTLAFCTAYFGAVFVYGLGFALLGLVIAELARRRSLALLLGLAFIVGVHPLTAYVQARLFVVGSQVQQLSQLDRIAPDSLLAWIANVYAPLSWTFERLYLGTQQLISGLHADVFVTVPAGHDLMMWWCSLAVFAGSWFALGWLCFPRSAGDRL